MRFAACFAAALAAVSLAFGQARPTRVDLTSQPAGATVILDGQDLGVTPLTRFDIEPGRHHAKFRLAGYVERDRFINVEEGRPLQRNVVLEPEKGLLLLRSVPDGCNITIDGLSVGQTPRLVTTLDAKDTHQVVLRKAGYRPANFEVKFTGRTPLVREETLVLDSGIIDVQTEPAGAEITVNGIVRGKSPLRVSDIPKGRATVKLRLAGFREEVRELAMNAGDRQVLALTLQGLPGTLSLNSVPAGARFYLNGEFVGLGPVIVPNLAPGSYMVKAEREGFGSEGRTIVIENGASPKEEFRLSSVMGRIELRTSPPVAHVLLDGKLLGTTSATDPAAETSDVFPIESVMEGEHVLVIRKDGYQEEVRHPKVANSKTHQGTVRLKRIFKPDVAIVTDQGTYEGVLVNNTPEYVTVEIKLGIQRSFPRADVRSIRFLREESK